MQTCVYVYVCFHSVEAEENEKNPSLAGVIDWVVFSRNALCIIVSGLSVAKEPTMMIIMRTCTYQRHRQSVNSNNGSVWKV
jgi:hypothetical protein